MKLKIKKGDIVQVIAGANKGEQGRVLEVYPDKMKILVERVNERSKHERPNPKNEKGGIVKREMPIHYSNVLLLDSDKNPTRIGIRREEKGGKIAAVRYAKTNNNDL